MNDSGTAYKANSKEVELKNQLVVLVDRPR